MALAHPDVHLPAGDPLDVRPEELVGEEQDLPVLGDRSHHRRGVRGGAADVGLGLHVGRGVHVGHDHGAGVLGLPGPEAFHVDGRGQRAASVEVGDVHALVRGEDGRGLGHEVHAAEEDLVGVGGRGLAGQLERVADNVGDVLDPRHLVVVGQDHGVPLLGQAPDLSGPGLETGG
jgi:hypothetical protein